MPSIRRSPILAAAALIVVPVVAATGQSAVTVSPFVSYMPSAATNPLAGFALTFGGTTGLALRSGAEMSISNPPIDSASAGGYRPWGADADLMLFLGGLGGGAGMFNRSLNPYGFAGIGMTGADSAGRNIVRHSWSYGIGAALPLGMNADIFGEARWRMAEYVLPTSQGAPDSKSSMRFGLSFHVGGGGQSLPAPRRRRMADRSDDVEYVVTPAPAPTPVVVVAPESQPAPAPQVIVVEQERQPDPVVVVEQESSRRRHDDRVIVASPDPVVVAAPERTRAPQRIYGRSTTRVVTTTPSSTTRSRQRAASTSRVIVRAPARAQTRVEAQQRSTTVQSRSRSSASRVVVPSRSRTTVTTRVRTDSTARVTRRPR